MIESSVVLFVVTGVVITGGVFGGSTKFGQQFVVISERRNVQIEQLFLVFQLTLEIFGHIVVAQMVARVRRVVSGCGSTISNCRYVT